MNNIHKAEKGIKDFVNSFWHKKEEHKLLEQDFSLYSSINMSDIYGKKNIIALETCTAKLSVCIYSAGIFYEAVVDTQRMHAKMLLPIIDFLLDYTGLSLSDIDFLSCSNGPGAFTGIRLGVGAIKGLSFGSDIKIIPVDTLSVLATQTKSLLSFSKEKQNIESIDVFLDARMNSAYYANYDYSNLSRKEDIKIIPFSDMKNISIDESKVISGNGILAYTLLCKEDNPKKNNFLDIDIPDILQLPRASFVIVSALSKGTYYDSFEVSAIYVRNNVTS